MTCKKIKIIRLNFENGYYIDISQKNKEGYRDFWLYHEEYGIAQYMFGCKASSEKEAIELACANINNYIPLLKEHE